MLKSKIRDFVAIDFETATPSRYACQIGIAIVEDGKLVKVMDALIQPPGNKYTKNCIRIHHITPDMTEDSPTFEDAWDSLRGFFEDNILVMHNADFDLSVLEASLKYYGIPVPALVPPFDTYKLFNRSLSTLCAGFGIDCKDHHDAGWDAAYSAQCFLKWLEGKKPDEDVMDEIEGTRRDEVSFHIQLTGDVLKKDLTNADPEGLFFDKRVVITGLFPLDRNSLAAQLKKMGADINTSISARTDYVLVGDEPGPKKIQKISELQSSGCKIEILRWADIESLFD